ncbi:SDR family NAD(P)-dependent oxidoreductase [Zoogloea sp. LCSB751]|uniref:SDR family NAD(P)-dependent oxidoreductase n=1 Tax=Zoogloea sp. LCSB751 TaxID=1965277 RepID=UPI0009A50200|nr:3-oxoacyl-ACP reductase family protein [Zoogloea sp. LCSB751]
MPVSGIQVSNNVLDDLTPRRQLAGQVALVTGASRGIGRAIALRLAAEGAHVVLHYRTDPALAEALAAEIRAQGGQATPYQADLAAPEGVDALAEAFGRDFEQLHILVNNAGITRDKLLLMMDDEDLQQVIATNLLAPMRMLREFAGIMLRQRYGRIVNISSSAASKPGRGQSNYAAAKGGLEAFTKAMAVELAPKGILVNAVAPGVIETEMSAQIRALGEGEILSRLLLKRYATPLEVADAVLYLVSPRNRYVTGEVLHLDGGLKMA